MRRTILSIGCCRSRAGTGVANTLPETRTDEPPGRTEAAYQEKGCHWGEPFPVRGQVQFRHKRLKQVPFLERQRQLAVIAHSSQGDFRLWIEGLSQAMEPEASDTL
jgi:hypothetical protein